MESDNGRNPAALRPHADQTLRDLQEDRASLAEHLRPPGWLYPIIAVLTAVFVATPALPPGSPRNTASGVLIVATVGVLTVQQRLSGARVGRVGLEGAALLVGLLAGVLLLLSVSFGLSASVNRWWVFAPAAACFLLVLTAGRWFDRLYRERLRRGP